MRLSVALWALLAAACGAPLPHQDSGPRVDAGTFFSDAGALVDAGFSVLRYPSGRTQSPLTLEVATHLQSIAALSPIKNAAVFSKIGDSNTVSTHYLSCFAGPNVDLGARASLEPALQHFLKGPVGSTTSFERTSLSAAVGWSAALPLSGLPAALQQELEAAQPRFATVMFGTNDVGLGDTQAFGKNMFALVDALARQGVVPLISAVPPRDDSVAADAWVPRYNLVARGVAQARKVPFIDLHHELLGLPAHGLGPDGIHLNVYLPGTGRSCAFTPAGLAFGHNTRNLATLEGLARAWDAVEGRPAPDATAPRIMGTGLPGDEVAIDALPFVDVRDTRTDGLARIDSYPGCAASQNERGREVLYRLELSQPTTVRVFVVSLGASDIDVHLLGDTASGQSCVERHDRSFVRQLVAGTHYFSLDTYQSSTLALAGEYLLGVMAEERLGPLR